MLAYDIAEVPYDEYDFVDLVWKSLEFVFKKRLSGDFQHRLRDCRRQLVHPSTASRRKDHCLHGSYLIRNAEARLRGLLRKLQGPPRADPPSPRKTLVTVRDLGTNPFDRSRSRLFAAQTKREPKAQCERDDDAGEKGLHEFRRDAELVQNRKDGSDPDRVLCDRPGQIT